MKINLQKRIIYPTIALFVGVMVITAGISYDLASKGLKENTISQLSLLVKSKAELFDLWMQDAKGVAEIAANLARTKELLKKDSDD